VILQILSHTPIWVGGLFVMLLAFGFVQTRSRNVNKFVAYVLPVVMIALSLLGIQSSFGLKPTPVALWAVGLILVTLCGYRFFRDRKVVFDRGTNSYFIPGSWIPFIVIMVIFLTKYTFAASRGLNVDGVNSPEVEILLSLAYGCFSGYFASRAANLVAQTRKA
jgi:hypothetical protein